MYSIGGTDFGQPSRVVGIDADTSSTFTLFDLATDSAGFSGLTYDPNDGMFYAVMDDGSGNSSLVKFSPSGGGAFSAVMALGYSNLTLAFNGGLVFDNNDGDFYSISNSPTGSSVLFRIDAGAGTVQRLTEALPLSFNGGLTVNPDGTLAGIRNDSNGNSSLYRFTLGTNTAIASPVALLGVGFYGGLTWNGGTLYALSSDFTALGTVNSIDASGNPTPLFDAGYGFLNAGMTTIPAAGTPEPATVTLAGLALCGFSLVLRRRRRG